MNWASPEAAYAPVADPWIKWPCCGDPVCLCTTMEQKITASGAPSSEPTERGPYAVHMPGPWPLRVDFWVPGTFYGSPWLLDHFPVQLGNYMSFCFEQYQDNLSCIYEILGDLTGQAWGGQPPTSMGTYPCLTIMSSFARSLWRLFKIQTISLSTMLQCPAPWPWHRASHQWPHSCLW